MHVAPPLGVAGRTLDLVQGGTTPFLGGWRKRNSLDEQILHLTYKEMGVLIYVFVEVEGTVPGPCLELPLLRRPLSG